MGIYLATDAIVGRFIRLIEQDGWEHALKTLFKDVFESLFNYILLLFIVLIFPVCFLVLKDFLELCVSGKMNLTQFFNHIPEIAATVASFYSNFFVWFYSIFQHLKT